MYKTNTHQKIIFRCTSSLCKRIRTRAQKTADGIECLYEKIDKHSLLFCICWSLLLTLFIETLGRLSTAGIFGGIVFMVKDPVVFVYNAFLIFVTLMAASVFKRQACIFLLISAWWIFVGIVNGIILTQRMTPFTMNDLSVVEDGFSIVSTYLSAFTIILCCLAVALALLAVLFLFIKGPKKKELKRGRNLVLYSLTVLFCVLATSFMINIGKVETFFGNIASAYRDYGTAYCFINTWTNTGIDKPADYSQDNINNLFGGDGSSENALPVLAEQDVDENYPNIIFLQLESFIDPETLKYIELSEDAVPTFRRLKEEYSSGILTVPACGAGTANVEFEVLTGYSSKFFGPGEYPYRTVLKNNTVETLAYDLRSIGYKAHAIHNHRAVFYSRDLVFANMGFDTFTSIEYMKNVEKTPKNWAKDAVLYDYIMKALSSTEEHDMIYTISVQGHGKYPGEQTIENPAISVISAPNEELKWRWEYYANQICEMDAFLAKLIAALEEWDEPVVLALYGDHIPAIDLTEDDLTTGSLYATEYVIWSNCGLPKEDKDLLAYDLAANIMERIGMRVGTAFTYKLDQLNNPDYISGLELLAYDTLYGKQYVYGGEKPFIATDIQLGIDQIKVTEIIEIDEQYYVKGENFTAHSKISLDGEILSTKFIDENTLLLRSKVEPEDLPNLKVSQVESKSKKVLSTTE